MGELTPEELLQEARRSLTAPTRRAWRGVTHQDLDAALKRLDDTAGAATTSERGSARTATPSQAPTDITENIPPAPGSAVLKLIKGGRKAE